MIQVVGDGAQSLVQPGQIFHPAFRSAQSAAHRCLDAEGMAVHAAVAVLGRSLGQVVRGETTPEFEAALLTLQPGQLCPLPVQTRYGVHILRLDRKMEGSVQPFELVQARIAQYLEDNAARRAAAQYVALLAGQAQIDGCAIAGAASPLMQ